MMPVTAPARAMTDRSADPDANAETTSEAAPNRSAEATNQVRSVARSDRRAQIIMPTAPQMYGTATMNPTWTTPNPSPLMICGIHKPMPTEPTMAQKLMAAQVSTRQFVSAARKVDE